MEIIIITSQQNIRVDRGKGKVMLEVFLRLGLWPFWVHSWRQSCVHWQNLSPWGCNQKETPEKLRTNRWFLPHDNAPSHRLVLVRNFLAENVTTMGDPPYSPDVAPADFYLFPQLKSATEGTALLW